MDVTFMCLCCVGSVLWDELITCSGKSYSVCVCVWSRNINNEAAWRTDSVCCATAIYMYIYLFIYLFYNKLVVLCESKAHRLEIVCDLKFSQSKFETFALLGCYQRLIVCYRRFRRAYQSNFQGFRYPKRNVVLMSWISNVRPIRCPGVSLSTQPEPSNNPERLRSHLYLRFLQTLCLYRFRSTALWRRVDWQAFVSILKWLDISFTLKVEAASFH
jgi:hypothetical protein